MNTEKQPQVKNHEQEVPSYEDTLRNELLHEAGRGKSMLTTKLTSMFLDAEKSTDPAHISGLVAEIKRLNQELERVLNSKLN